MKARKSILLSLLLGFLFFFTVQAQGAAPTITDISNQTTDEDTATGAIGFTVGDPDTPIEDLIVSGESSDQALLPDANIVFGGEIGENRTVTLTPAANQNGTVTITITVSDDVQTASVNFDLTVNPVNDAPPVCTDVVLTTPEDTNGATTPSCSDIDGDNLTFSIVAQAANGTATTSTIQLLYDPSDDFFGGDTFTYKANDGTADSNTANVTVTVTAVNDAPVCQAVLMTTDEEVTGTTDPDCTDAENDDLTYEVVDQPANGSADVVSGQLEYSPELNYFGIDLFTYRANDSDLDSATANVDVTVNPLNDNPSNITLTGNTVVEMIEPPVVIGSFSSTDVDGGPTYSYDLVSAAACASDDNDSFTILGNSLRSIVAFDFETKPDTKEICVQTDDGNGGTFNKSFTINVQDKPKGSITVTPITSLTTEAGGEASFSMVLDFRPTANVNVSLSSNDPSEGIVLPPITLTFTTANWKIAQVVHVKGVDDLLADGSQTYTIVTASSVSADPDYSGVNPADVVMQNSDNDTAGLTVAPLSGLITTEGKGSAKIQVKLNTQPTTDVTLNFTSSDLSEGTVSPASLLIKPSDWNLVKEVTVTGVDDKEIDGNKNYKINISTTSSDGNYNNKKQSVDATNRDAPTIKWASPVSTGQTYDINDLVPFLLKVIKDSPEPITKVRFYRWDAVKSVHVNIGEVQDPPYQIFYDPARPGNKLNSNFNQFYAVAYNAANVTSEHIHIWVFKQGSKYTLYPPIVIRDR